ncbi:VOC family protein, partial [Pseudomonas aeruginosa]
MLVDVLGMRHDRSFEAPEGTVHVFAMGEGGSAAEVQLVGDASAPARQGAGAVHHVAFRIPDADYAAWADRLQVRRMPSSGPVDRYYF